MNDMQPEDSKLQEEHDQLRSERKARGAVRNAHLEAGREQAQRDNTLARKRNASVPPPIEDKSDIGQEAEPEVRKGAQANSPTDQGGDT
jgi:hypothetical protein